MLAGVDGRQNIFAGFPYNFRVLTLFSHPKTIAIFNHTKNIPMKNISLIAVCSFLISFAACKKSDTPAPKTKTELIASGTWKFSNAKVGGTDVSAFLQSCQKDNTITFVAAGTGTADEGPTKCNSGDPQTTPFTWSFASGETQLTVSTVLFTGGSNTFTVVSITATELVLSQNITVSGTTQNAVVTFVH
jgi:hypothetical protein